MQNETIDIFIMDDDADICMLMKSVLHFAGYKVQTFSNPDLMHAHLSVKIPKLIIMDMLLSGADGRDVCTFLKSQERTKNIKIMMMSAHPDGEQTCLLAGAGAFLEKPFDIDNLLSKVRQII